VAGNTGFSINLETFTQLLATLRVDVDEGLVPGARQATQQVGSGAAFGLRNPSGEIVAAHRAMEDAARMFGANLAVHLHNADEVMKAGQKQLAAYQSADLFAQATTAQAARANVVGSPEPDEMTSARSGENVSAMLIGPLPHIEAPPPLEIETFCVNWGAYDVPRLWSALRDEGNAASWAQIDAYRRLGDALEAQYRRMLLLRSQVAAIWSGSAAESFLAVWDTAAYALGKDALCATKTSRALEGMVTTLTQTRQKLASLDEQWQSVTHDWTPELFDSAAADANAAARKAAIEMDRALQDYRAGIISPIRADAVGVFKPQPIDETGSTSGAATASPRSSGPDPAPARTATTTTMPVSPLPNINPVLTGPGLVGAPVPVSTSPVTPPSLLPIPPGVSELAPGGGGYVLPGPWARAGKVLPMPSGVSRYATIAGGSLAARTGAAGAPGSSMVASPGVVGAPAGGPREQRRQRMGTEHWKVVEGVPPVIGEREIVESPPNPLDGDSDADEDFAQWFARVAMPRDAPGHAERPDR